MNVSFLAHFKREHHDKPISALPRQQITPRAVRSQPHELNVVSTIRLSGLLFNDMSMKDYRLSAHNSVSLHVYCL